MTVLIVLLSIALIACIFLVIYPYAIYPLLLRRLPERPVATDPTYFCSATLVFCAFNEAQAMPEKLANIEVLKERYPDLEVLAFDDGSTDSTLEQLTARPDLLQVVQGGGRNGKAHGMKLLAARATGEIIIFTDANVLLQEDAIDHLRCYYADSEVGGICGRLDYLGEGDTITASVGGIYWRLEEYLKMQESRSGNVMGADGSIFSLRRALYPEFPDTVLDDLTVSMAAVFARKRLIKVENVVAYERLVTSRGEEFARKVRIASRAYHTHLYLRPQLAKMAPIDKFKYRSRKLVRWFGGLFMLLAVLLALAICSLVSLWLGLVALVTFVALILMGWKGDIKPMSTLVEIGIALIATLIGVIKAMRGRSVVTWNPAKSR